MGTAAGQREAIVAVVRREPDVLVIRRAATVPYGGYWTPLSGKIEPGEEQAAAVARESLEEVGLVVVPQRLVWECDTEDGVFRLYWWTARAEPGELTLDPAEVGDARWIRPEEFGRMSPTFASDRDFFARVYPGVDGAS